MKEYIGYSLNYVLEKIGNNAYQIIYNCDELDKVNELYVTNLIKKESIYIITVSHFQIEV